MKKFLIVASIFIAFNLYAKEATLFDATTDASFEEWSYSDNFRGVTMSGNIESKDIFRLDKNENGIRFYSPNIPNKTFNYQIRPAYSSFINEPNVGAGYLDNVGDIKSIKLTCILNRPYDEVTLLYSTSRLGEIKKVKFRKPFTQVGSMQEVEFVWDNPNYDSDVRNRPIKSQPLIGSAEDGLYFRGIEVKCNEVFSGSEQGFSSVSVVYLKKIDVIYDLMFEESVFEQKKELNEEFGLDKTTEQIKNKERDRLRFENNYYQKEEEKKATEDTQDSK